VAKATFYKHFPSKDDLVRAYVESQSRLGRTAIARIGAMAPRARIFAIFDLVADAAAHPGYRGCPFLNAAAEYPDPRHPVRLAIDAHRRWKRELLRDFLAADGHPDPRGAADALTVVSDGLLIASHIDKPADLGGLIRQTVSLALAPSGQDRVEARIPGKRPARSGK
jgi:AcrR family transcriptional regulator